MSPAVERSARGRDVEARGQDAQLRGLGATGGCWRDTIILT